MKEVSDLSLQGTSANRVNQQGHGAESLSDLENRLFQYFTSCFFFPLSWGLQFLLFSRLIPGFVLSALVEQFLV